MTGRSSAAAVLFDVDGTLVDSNYLHVHAWQRAFAAVKVDVEAWRIHRGIGMDGSTLVQKLSGDAPEDVQNELKDRHSEYYRETSELLTPLPGARELLSRINELGVQVVLATSAPEDELALLRQVLDCDDLIAAYTSAQDVDTAKPDPGIVQIALDRAHVSADQAVFVGDAIWDAKAARRAGVTCIGVRSGGVSDAELESSGATAVFDNAQALLDNIGQSPISRLLRD